MEDKCSSISGDQRVRVPGTNSPHNSARIGGGWRVRMLEDRKEE